MGRQDPPNMEANLGSQKSIFEAQVGLHFGGGLGGPWAPQSIFLEAQVGLLVGGVQVGQLSILVLISILKRIVGQLGPPQQGAQLGPPKKCHVAPHGRQDPPKMEANMGLKK